MKRQPNKRSIGAFILAGIATFLVIVAIALGLGMRGRDHDLYVMYFHESIKGLSVGAPVVLNGVEVGKVVKIEIVPDVNTYEFTIPVYVVFNNISKSISAAADGHKWDEDKMVTALIERGLYGQLINQSILTGQLMIELNVNPSRGRVTGTDDKDADIHEIPTALSSLGELSANVSDIPLRDVVDNLNQTLLELKDVLTPAAQIGKDLATRSAATINNFNTAVLDISRAANAIRNLADYLERHPESLIKGK